MVVCIFSLILSIGGCKGNNSRTSPKDSSSNKDISKFFDKFSPLDTPINYYKHMPAEVELAFFDAKWRMYCMYCDSSFYKLEYDTLCGGELDFFLERILDSTRLEMKDENNKKIADAFEFDFGLAYRDTNLDYYYHHKLELLPENRRPINNIKSHEEIRGLVYSLRQPYEPIFMLLSHYYLGTRISLKETKWGGKNLTKFRLIYPMQPEVIYYIRKNAAKINPWFYAEAKKRGVFDSVKYPPYKIQAAMEANKKGKNKVKSWQEYLQ